MFLLPTEVMKSDCTSTLFLSAQACDLLAHDVIAGRDPMVPEADRELARRRPPVRICTSGNAAAVAPIFSALRRVTAHELVIRPSLLSAGSVPAVSLFGGKRNPGDLGNAMKRRTFLEDQRGVPSMR